jgi:23S rRNA G2445 N2-methylase RlmL
MKLAAVSLKYLEKFVAEEIKDIIGVKTTTKESIVLFEADPADAAKFCYHTRTANRVFKIFHEIPCDINSLDFSLDFGIEFKTFKVKAERSGSHDFQSLDAEVAIGAYIADNMKKQVSLKNPELIFYAFISDKIYLGIDLIGFELNKRDYKIYNNPFSIKGNLAYSMLMFAGWNEKKILLDPFIKSGEIVIEAASKLSGKSIHSFKKEEFALLKLDEFKGIKFEEEKSIVGKIIAFSDNQKYLFASQKNSKIQELGNKIKFSRVDLKWLDLKFEEHDIDCIVTIISKGEQKDLKKQIKDFFWQMEFILAKKGTIVILTKERDMFDNIEKFKIIEEISLENSWLLKFNRI